MSSPKSPLKKSDSVRKLYSKYNIQDKDEFVELKDHLASHKTIATSEMDIALNKQLMNFISSQSSKKNKAKAMRSPTKLQSIIIKKQPMKDVQMLETEINEVEGKVVIYNYNQKEIKQHNLKLQRVVKKVKQRLKTQQISKEQKFVNTKINPFQHLDTFVDIKAFLQQLNPTRSTDTLSTYKKIHSKDIELQFDKTDHQDTQEDDIFDYGEVIRRSKKAILNNEKYLIKRTNERIMNQDLLKENPFIQEINNSSRIQQDLNESYEMQDSKFYKYIDDLIETTNNKQILSEEQKMQEEEQQNRIEQQKAELINLFRKELSRHPSELHQFQVDDMSARERDDRGYLEKSRKVIQLLERANKQLYNKKVHELNVNLKVQNKSARNKPKRQPSSLHSSNKKSIGIPLPSFIQSIPENAVLEEISEKEDKQKFYKLPSIRQANNNDVMNFNKQIKSNRLLRNGVSLNNIMEFKQFCYDNSEKLISQPQPQLSTAINQIFSVHKRLQTEKSDSTQVTKSFKQNLVSPTIRHIGSIESVKCPIIKVSIKQQLNRSKLNLLIGLIDQTKDKFQHDRPIFQSEITKFQDGLQNSIKYTKEERLESLKFFSKTERKGTISPIRRSKNQKKQIQIL